MCVPTLAIFMYYWITSGQLVIMFFTLVFMPWNFEYTKDVTLKMGGAMGQGLATEVSHLRLNQPLVT